MHHIKKLFVLVMTALMLLSNVSTIYAAETETETEAETEPETEAKPTIKDTDIVSTKDIAIYSESCVVMDLDSGNILYSKNMDEVLYPASITKVMTALLFAEFMQPDDTVTFTNEAIDGIDIWQDMNIGMQAGETLTADQTLHAFLMVSANEVAAQAGIAVSGSTKAFANLMNSTAASLGCTNTHFVNANGLHDDKHYTTAHDMALIAKEAYKYPWIRDIMETLDYTIEFPDRIVETETSESGETSGTQTGTAIEMIQQHKMLLPDTAYTYEGCLGGKTGFTNEAHGTLVTYAKRGDMRLVCVSMKADNWHHYDDTIKTLDYCFNNFQTLNISEHTSFLSTLDNQTTDPLLTSGENAGIHFFMDTDARLTIPSTIYFDQLTERFVANTDKTLRIAPFDNNTGLYGTLQYLYNNQVIGTANVYEYVDPNINKTSQSMIQKIAKNRLAALDNIAAQLKKNNLQRSAFDTLIGRSLDWLSHTLNPGNNVLSPRTLVATGIVSGIIVILFAWIIHSIQRKRSHRRYQQLKAKRKADEARHKKVKKKLKSQKKPTDK